MEQVPLKLKEQLVYSHANFLVHSGVKSLVELLKQNIVADSFSLNFVYGPKRSGKTHLLVYLTNFAQLKHKSVLLLEGQQFADYLNRFTDIDNNALVLVDNAELYLNTLSAGGSGPLVAFIEKCRVKKIPILLFSAAELVSFHFDEHVSSRIKMGSGSTIMPPSFEEFITLFNSLAEQRGMKLSERQLDFLNKRLGGSILELENYVDKLYLLKMEHGRDKAFELLKKALD